MLSTPNRQLCAFFATFCAILAGNDAAEAQTTPGVTGKEIVIGSCGALEGPSSFLGRETVAGAEAYFRFVNDKGGINGRKLRLFSADDSYDPAKAEACREKLTGTKGVCVGVLCGDAHGREVCAVGGEPPDSACGTVHRSADALPTATPLGHQCAPPISMKRASRWTGFGKHCITESSE